MLKIEEITAIMGEITPLLKAYYGKDEKERKKSPPPDYNPIYADTVMLQQEVAVHSEIKDFPEKLFKAKAPNESDEQWSYRKDNYQPVTMPFWNRALAVMNRVWNENNYELKWGDGDQSGYFLKDYPKYGKILAYFESVVTRDKVNDPNALIVVKPWYLPTITNDKDEIILADNKEIDAIAEIYCAEKVIRTEREYAMVMLDEKSALTYNNQTVQEGLIFELYDDTLIWRIEQYGKKVDWTFKINEFYRHNLGYIPAQRLKGIPLNEEGYIYYKSILYDATPLLNEALYDSSTLSISKVGAAFPIRWVYSDECTYQGPRGERCEHGQLKIFEGEGDSFKMQNCPGCNGTGYMNPFTPMGIMHVKAQSSSGVTLAEDRSIPTPPLGFVGPDVQILEYLRQEIESNIIRAFEMLNIDVSNSKVKGSDTALGKQIDREELFSFLQVFSSEIFDLFGFVINAIGRMRFLDKWKAPLISKPVNFAIRSEADLTEEITQAKANNMPEVALRRLMAEYNSVRFTDSAQATAITDLIMRVDVLFTFANADIISGLGAGAIQKWENELHKNINIYIQQELEANANFLTQKFEEQRAALIARAKADVAANAPMAAEAIVNKAVGAAA